MSMRAAPRLLKIIIRQPGYHDCAQLGIYLLDIGRSRHTMCKLRIPRHRVGTTDSGEKSLPVHVIVNQHAEITVTGPVRPPTHGQQAAKTSGNYRRERSEEHTSELQSLMRISYAAFCLKTTKHNN